MTCEQERRRLWNLPMAVERALIKDHRTKSLIPNSENAPTEGKTEGSVARTLKTPATYFKSCFSQKQEILFFFC